MEIREKYGEEKSLKVFVNGIPNLLLIPSIKARGLIEVLERQIAKFYEKNSQKPMENSGKSLTG